MNVIIDFLETIMLQTTIYQTAKDIISKAKRLQMWWRHQALPKRRARLDYVYALWRREYNRQTSYPVVKSSTKPSRNRRKRRSSVVSRRRQTSALSAQAPNACQLLVEMISGRSLTYHYHKIIQKEWRNQIRRQIPNAHRHWYQLASLSDETIGEIVQWDLDKIPMTSPSSQ